MNPYAPQNPYAAPAAPVMPAGYAPGPSLARIEGQLLVVANGGTFPPVCLRCGATHPIEWRDQKFMYVPALARLLGALIQLMVAKRSRFNLPLCQACNAEWKKWNLFLGLSWLPGLFLIVVAGGVASALGGDAAVVVFLLGLAVLLGGILTAAVIRSRRTIVATKIDKTSTWLKGVAMQAQQAIVAPQQAYGAQAPGAYYPPR
jgi:hypothetical protein